MSKCSALLLLLLLASSSLIMSGFVCASTAKPSVPDFTVEIVDHSYDVPMTTTNYINPYTGQQETKTSGGYHVENMTVDIAIRNQPFIPVTVNGNTTGLFYVIRWKGHYEEWRDYGNLNDVAYENSFPGISYAIPASASEYTVKSYSISSIGNISQRGEVDFQVKAQIGYSFLYFGGHIQPIGTNYHWVEESDWSTTQTLSISGSTPSTSPGTSLQPPSASPSESSRPTAPSTASGPQNVVQLGLDWIQFATLALLTVIAALLVSVVLLLRKRKVSNTTNTPSP